VCSGSRYDCWLLWGLTRALRAVGGVSRGENDFMAFGSFCCDSPYRVVVELSVQWIVEICVPFAALMQAMILGHECN
jgi:hypothetical protein